MGGNNSFHRRREKTSGYLGDGRETTTSAPAGIGYSAETRRRSVFFPGDTNVVQRCGTTWAGVAAAEKKKARGNPGDFAPWGARLGRRQKPPPRLPAAPMRAAPRRFLLRSVPRAGTETPSLPGRQPAGKGLQTITRQKNQIPRRVGPAISALPPINAPKNSRQPSTPNMPTRNDFEKSPSSAPAKLSGRRIGFLRCLVRGRRQADFAPSTGTVKLAAGEKWTPPEVLDLNQDFQFVRHGGASRIDDSGLSAPTRSSWS